MPTSSSSSSPFLEYGLSEHCVLLALRLQLVLPLSQEKTDQKINDSVRSLCFGASNKGNC